jgi:hypothetical protein
MYTKTLELARLQVGEASPYVNVVVSTLAEAELLTGYLQEAKAQGRAVNVCCTITSHWFDTKEGI